MDIIDRHIVAMLIIVLALFFMLLGGTIGYMAVIPRCSEDVVLVGAGSFDAGRWTQYTCGPAVDDYR